MVSIPPGSPQRGITAGFLGGLIVSGVLNRILSAIFQGFNAGFRAATGAYTRIVGVTLRGAILVLLGYGGLLYLTYYGFAHTPTGFIPTQDKGYLLVNVQMPDSTSLEQTQRVMQQIEVAAAKVKGVNHTVAIAGQSILLNANAPNFGAMYVMLDDFSHRESHELSGDAIAAKLQTLLQDEIQDGLINIFGAPPIEGLGTAGGFKLVIEDRGDTGLDTLQSAADRIVGAGNNTKGLEGLFTSFRANTPGSSSISTGARSRPWGLRPVKSSIPCKFTWVHST